MMKIRKIKKVNLSEKIQYLSVLVLMISLFGIPDNTPLSIISRIFVIIVLGIYSIRHIRITIYLGWAMFFLGISLASVLWASDSIIALNNVFKILQLLLVCVFFNIWVDSSGKMNFVLKSIVMSALIIIFRIFIEVPLNYWGVRRFSHVLNLNINTIAIRLTFSIIISLYLIKGSSKKMSITYLGYISVASLLVILLGSRRSILILVLCSSFFMIFSSKNIVKKIKWALFSLLLVIFVFYIMLNVPALYNIIGRRFINMLHGITSGSPIDQSRNELIQIGLKLFVEKPLWGWGVGNYAFVSGMGVYSHNNYIELLSTVGLLGFLLYYSIHLKLLYQLLISRLKGYNIMFASLWIGILLSDFAAPSYSSLSIHILIALATAFKCTAGTGTMPSG